MYLSRSKHPVRSQLQCVMSSIYLAVVDSSDHVPVDHLPVLMHLVIQQVFSGKHKSNIFQIFDKYLIENQIFDKYLIKNQIFDKPYQIFVKYLINI